MSLECAFLGHPFRPSNTMAHPCAVNRSQVPTKRSIHRDLQSTSFQTPTWVAQILNPLESAEHRGDTQPGRGGDTPVKMQTLTHTFILYYSYASPPVIRHTHLHMFQKCPNDPKTPTIKRAMSSCDDKLLHAANHAPIKSLNLKTGENHAQLQLGSWSYA